MSTHETLAFFVENDTDGAKNFVISFLMCCFFILFLFYSFCHVLSCLLKTATFKKRAVYLHYNEYKRIEYISSEKRGKKLRNVVEKKLKLIHSFIAL